MCNPIAVVATLAGAVVGKKAGENKQKKKQQKKQKEIKKSEEMEKSNASNPLIPDTFQARVRLGDTREYEDTNSGYTIGNNKAFGGAGKAMGNMLSKNPFLGGRR